MKIDSKLDGFYEHIEGISSPNAGGCLFMCYFFWKWLQKNNLPTESFEIVQYEGWGDDNSIEHNIQWIDECDINDGADHHPISSHHFTWMYEGVEYDACGVVTREYTDTKEILSGLNGVYSNLIEIFCVEALTKAIWNDWFDRIGTIEYIKKMYDIDLANVYKQTFE